MRLTDLDARFVAHLGGGRLRCVKTIGEADGVMFLCPKCFAANGGPCGTHSVICWSPTVPRDVAPGPGRWTMRGSGIVDLTLIAPSSSIAISGGCRAHFFVRDGAIVDC